MAQPQKEDYSECAKCTAAHGGRAVIYHYSQLIFVEPFWGGESHWECPERHEVSAPPVKQAAPPPAAP